MLRPIDSYLLKRIRGEQHFQTLHAEIQRFLELDPYQTITEFNSDSGLYEMRVAVLAEPPPYLSVIVGDILHNLRSGLDHLITQLMITQLTEAFVGGPLKRTEFPIFDNRDSYWRRDGKGRPDRASGLFKTRGVPFAATAIIEASQPYYRGNLARLHPLWLLHDLSNEDKHRMLNIVGGTMTGGAVRITTRWGRPIGTAQIQYGAFEDNAVLAYISVPGDDHPAMPPDGYVQLDREITFNVAFAKEGPGRGLPVAPTLARISEYTGQLAIDLEPYLPIRPSTHFR